MFNYKAQVKSVYDGDTITVDIDLGFGVFLRDQKIRLLGIDTPEVRGKERQQGLISRDRLRERIDGKKITIRTKKAKKGKYGRWLGEIWYEEESINDWLLTEGLAKKYE